MSSRLRSSQSILLFYESFIKSVPQVRFSSAAVISYNNSRLKVVFVNVLILFTIFFFCEIVSCWYRLRSLSCETSGVFQSACGLETRCQVMSN